MRNLLLEQAATLTDVADKFNGIMKSIVGPVIAFIGVLAIVYAIVLGVQYAKAEDANKRKEVQGRLVGAAIGAVIILVAVVLCFSINWAKVFESLGGTNGV